MVSICQQCERPGFDPWFGKTAWRRARQPISVFMPGVSPWTEDPVDYSPWGHKESDATKRLSTQHKYISCDINIYYEIL